MRAHFECAAVFVLLSLGSQAAVPLRDDLLEARFLSLEKDDLRLAAGKKDTASTERERCASPRSATEQHSPIGERDLAKKLSSVSLFTFTAQNTGITTFLKIHVDFMARKMHLFSHECATTHCFSRIHEAV